MENQEESIKLPGKKASEEDKSWHEFVRAQQQKEAERVEDAAKYLSGMIGIAFAIFLKTDADAFSHQASSGTVTWAAGLWLLSLCISFFIFFPWKYAYSTHSAESIRQMNRRTVRVKRSLLIASMALFFIALLLLAFVYFQPTVIIQMNEQ